MSGTRRRLWLDVSAGVAGDMILGALLDAGASLDLVQAQVDCVLPGSAVLSVVPVTRAGLHASHLNVAVTEPDPTHRSWGPIELLLHGAPLEDVVRSNAPSVFHRFAAAEAQVHGISAQDVHFHEVGAIDAVADIGSTPILSTGSTTRWQE